MTLQALSTMKRAVISEGDSFRMQQQTVRVSG